jgi:dynein light chain 4
MPIDIQSEAVDLIVSAIDNSKQNNTSHEAAAKQVKEAMDRKFGASWHCVVGEGFSYGCTSEEQSLLVVFYQGNLSVLLFKC